MCLISGFRSFCTQVTGRSFMKLPCVGMSERTWKKQRHKTSKLKSCHVHCHFESVWEDDPNC
jgi:hypothetical protein